MKENDDFRNVCKKIRMRDEYPGYSGPARWLLITNMGEDELKRLFPEEMGRLRSYVVITRRQAVPVREYRANEAKFMKRYLSNTLLYGDAEPEVADAAMTGYGEAERKDSEVRKALGSLSEKQRLRIIRRFYRGYSVSEIAEMDRVSYQAVKNSIDNGLKRIGKRILRCSDAGRRRK